MMARSTSGAPGGCKSLMKIKALQIQKFNDNKINSIDFGTWLESLEEITSTMQECEKPFFLKDSIEPQSEAFNLVINRTKYSEMVLALQQAYGNKAILLQQRINELISFFLNPSGTNDATNLRKIHSRLLYHTSYLSTRTADAAQLGNLLLVSLSLQRLPNYPRIHLTEKSKL